MRAALGVAAVAPLLAVGVVAGRSPEPIHVGYRAQVFVVNVDGGARRLTGGSTPHSGGIWSRRGQRIAVLVEDRVEIRDLRGKVKHFIDMRSGGLSWAPDDRRVAFVRLRRPKGGERFVGDLLVTDLDGRHRRSLDDGVATAVWAPRGRRIFYVRGNLGYGRRSLWSIRSDGSGRRRLAKNLAYFSSVAVSPDGEHLLFVRYDRDTMDGGHYAIRARGGRERKLTDKVLTSSCGWAPNGRGVYCGNRNGHPLIISPSGRRRTLRAKFYVKDYSWSPDGRWLAWSSERYNHSLVFAIRPNGTGRHVLARFTSRSSLTEMDTPGWSPDSRRLVVSPVRHVGD